MTPRARMSMHTKDSRDFELDRLQAEIDRLRVALNKIVELGHYPDESIARHALGNG